MRCALYYSHNALLDLEEMEEHELDRIRLNYSNLAKKAREDLRQGISDTGRPDMDKKDSTTAAGIGAPHQD